MAAPHPSTINTPPQGRTIAVVGDVYRFLATGEDTNGKYALWEAVVPPGGGPPPHLHSREEEGFYVLDGEKPWRDRDDEFVDTFTSRDELLAHWESGWQRLFDSLAGLSSGDVARTVAIRGEPHSVPLAIQRSLAHCGYHVGQIVLIARILAGDRWTTITIPRGGSAGFNRRVWGEGHYQGPRPGGA